MGWFNKKKEEKTEKSIQEDIPNLPDLPQLPPLKSYAPLEKYGQITERLPSLPSMSNRPLEQKFTQNIIKDAVNESEEDREEYSEQKEPLSLLSEEGQEFKTNKLTREYGDKMSKSNSWQATKIMPSAFEKASRIVKQKEPVFIRLDKFQEGLELFNDIREKVEEIQAMLQEVKEIKIKEDAELEQWEAEIQSMKEQIERIDKNIFSQLP